MYKRIFLILLLSAFALTTRAAQPSVLGTEVVKATSGSSTDQSLVTPTLKGASGETALTISTTNVAVKGTLTANSLTVSNTVSLTLPATNYHWMANAVNVKSPPYNATGDGVTDDTAAITNAFWNSTNIYLPAGTYSVSATIFRRADGVVFGDGIGQTIILGSVASGVLLNCATNNTSFKDIEINGGGSGSYSSGVTGTSDGLVFGANGKADFVERCLFRNFSANALKVTAQSSTINNRTNYATIINNHFSNCWTSIYLTNTLSEYTKIEANTIIASAQSIYLGSPNALIVGNRITDGNIGIYITGLAANRGHCLINGNQINHMSLPITVVGLSTGAGIIGNQIMGGGVVTLTTSSGVLFEANLCEITTFNFSGGGLNRVINNTFYGGTFPTFNHNVSSLASRAWIAGNVGTTGIACPTSELQTLSAASAVTNTMPKIRVVGNGGATTLTSTPSIINTLVPDGIELILTGTDDSNTVTLQSESALTGSKLKLGAASRSLGAGDVLKLVWDSSTGFWLETSFVNN